MHHTQARLPQTPMELIMKTTASILFAAALTLSSAPAYAVVLDLSTMTCKQFVEGGDDTIKMVLTWMDGWYKGNSDKAIIDTDVFVENAKQFGTYCGENRTMSIVNAAESVSASEARQGGLANGSGVCAPDDKLRVPRRAAPASAGTFLTVRRSVTGDGIHARSGTVPAKAMRCNARLAFVLWELFRQLSWRQPWRGTNGFKRT